MTARPEAVIAQPLLILWLTMSVVTACAAACACFLAATDRRRSRACSAFMRFCLAAVVLAASVDPDLQAVFCKPNPLVRLAVGMAGTLAAVAILRMPSPRSRELGAWVAAGLLLLACGASSARSRIVSRPRAFGWAGLVPPAAVFEDREKGAHAVTDRGTTIQLGRFLPPAEPPDLPEDFAGQAILANDQPSPSNCHGWVFTRGRYRIVNEDVDRILQDNGYATVGVPQAHDLIVYRDDQGGVIHTGVVKAVGPDGFVLVESKWGHLHTYWHTPESQGYSQKFDYWRSPRDGHVLTIIDPHKDADPATASPPAG